MTETKKFSIKFTEPLIFNFSIEFCKEEKFIFTHTLTLNGSDVQEYYSDKINYFCS